MTKAPDITLASVKDSLKQEKVHRVSDFVSKEEVEQIKRNNAVGKKRKRQFDNVDAIEAEVIARFGYDVFLKWQDGEIRSGQMNKWILAERARENAYLISFKALVANGLIGAARPAKKGKAPRTNKTIQKIMKEEVKLAKGEF